MRRWSTIGVDIVVLCAVVAGCDDPAPGQAPTANLELAGVIDLGARARLDGSGSTDPDGDIISYRFTIADGTATLVSDAPWVEHVFRVSGTFDVVLEVIDSTGQSDSTRAVVVVREP